MDMSTESLVQLVRSAQQGDRQAMGELFTQFQGSVMAVALRRLRNYAEAQELCQDVFVQAMTKVDQLRDPECFGSWIRAITHRMAINRGIRQSMCVATEPQTFEATCVDHRTPVTRALDAERSGQVHNSLKRLGRMDRETLVAFYLRGESLLEMADHFDAPLGTIKRRLHVARKRLAVEMEEAVAI